MNHSNFHRFLSGTFAVVLAFLLCSIGTVAIAEEQTPYEKYAAHTPINLWGSEIPYNDDGRNTDFVPTIVPYIAKDNPTGACAIIFPGGGYSYVSGDYEGADVARFLNGKGISAFVVNYRTTERGNRQYDYRAILSDGLRAVRYARYNADEFGIDPYKIFTMGFSAGGHLTSMTATHFDFEIDDPNYTHDIIDSVSARPDAAAPCYAVASIEKSYTHAGTSNIFSGGDSQIKFDYSAENSVTGSTPPIFLWHTWDDNVVPVQNCLGFAAALADYGIPCEMHIYMSGRHGIGLGQDNATAKSWSDSLVNWVNRIFEGE